MILRVLLWAESEDRGWAEKASWFSLRCSCGQSQSSNIYTVQKEMRRSHFLVNKMSFQYDKCHIIQNGRCYCLDSNYTMYGLQFFLFRMRVFFFNSLWPTICIINIQYWEWASAEYFNGGKIEALKKYRTKLKHLTTMKEHLLLLCV